MTNIVRQILIRFILILFGLILSVLLAEFTLRIYNPFPLPYHNSILLHNQYTVTSYNPQHYEDIDDTVKITKNFCGFRGPELQDNYHTRILFVGGSTTECLSVSDGKDWPNLIGSYLMGKDSSLWVNNAGMGGNSTFGHLILMEHLVKNIKPDYVFFMVGINDAHIHSIREEDKGMFEYFQSGWRGFIFSNSRLAQTIKFLMGVKEARKQGLPDEKVDFATVQPVDITSDSIQDKLQELRAQIIKEDTGYMMRVAKLIELCRQHAIKPVFIAQVTAAGCYDSTHRNDLNQLIQVKWGSSVKLYPGKWAKDQNDLYNHLTKEVCESYDVDFIRLDSLLPCDTGNFIDFIHFNNKGCREVASKMIPEIEKVLKMDKRLN